MSRSCGSEDDFYLNWQVEKRPPAVGFRRQNSTATASIDRLSLSSGDSGPHSTYDHPKTVLKVTSSPKSLKRNTSAASAASMRNVVAVHKVSATRDVGAGELGELLWSRPQKDDRRHSLSLYRNRNCATKWCWCWCRCWCWRWCWPAATTRSRL